LAGALTRAGVPVEMRTYAGVGHAGIVTAFATILRGKAPVLADTAAFASRVTTPSRQAR
jgi:hypothetical protein